MYYNIKQRVKKIIVLSPPLLRLACWATRRTPRIFMYHRFCGSCTPENICVRKGIFEKQLSILLNLGFRTYTVREYIDLRRQQKEIPSYFVSITVDDGYKDFYEVAYPLLRAHGLKATFFVATQFVNERTWLWPDIVIYAIKHAKNKIIEINLPDSDKGFTFDLSDPAVWDKLIRLCISLPNEQKWKLIDSLKEQASVDLPETVLPEYEPVDWDNLKQMVESQLVEVGSHSHRHPILSKISPKEYQTELAYSKQLIGKKLGIEVTSFCYPNGQPRDYSDSVIAAVRASGYLGATVGYCRPFDDLYQLPRMGILWDHLDFLWKLSGFEYQFNK